MLTKWGVEAHNMGGGVQVIRDVVKSMAPHQSQRERERESVCVCVERKRGW